MKAKAKEGQRFIIISNHPSFLPYLKSIAAQTENNSLSLKFKENPFGINNEDLHVVEVWTEISSPSAEFKEYNKRVNNLLVFAWVCCRKPDRTIKQQVKEFFRNLWKVICDALAKKLMY